MIACPECIQSLASVCNEVQLLPVEDSSEEDVERQLDLLLDLQSTDLNTSVKDLRFLLVKELRHILSCEKQPIKKLALFRKTEAAARLKLTTRFIQRLTVVGSVYEKELLQQLRTGGKEIRRTITKLFVTNTAEQVEEFLGAPTFFSPELQTLLCLVMQVEPKDLTMQRETLERIINQYILDPLIDRRHIMPAVFAHINSETLLFTDKEKNLILDFLELAWDMYYSHSVQILEALKMQDRTQSALDWLRWKLSNARDAITSLNGRQVLDRFGFLSASYLLRWVGSKSLPRLSLLLPNCRLAHVTGTTPVTFASTGDFAAAMEFTGLVGTVERVDERLFSLVINSFSAHDFSALQRYKVSAAEPTFKLEVLQLTPTAAQSLRQPLTTHGTSSRDLKGLLSGMIAGMPSGNACLSVFDWLFTGGASELRTLLNLELATIYMRMSKDPHLPLDRELQDLFLHWFASVELEKRAVLEELQHQMDEVTRDPNSVIESFFFNPELASKVITNPTYTTLGNTAAISAMAAVVQLKTLTWAVNLTPESLRKVQLLVVSNPTLRLTHHLAIEKGIVTPAGKQKVLRRDIVERLAVILEITARLHHRFFDNLAALLPTQLRDRLKTMLCGRRRSNTLTETRGRDTRGSLEELFDRTGFYSAFDLMVFAKSSGVTVNLIAENSRAITIGKADDKTLPITVVEDPESGEFRRATNGGKVVLPSGMTPVTWFELPGVRLTNAVSSTFPTPEPPVGLLERIKRRITAERTPPTEDKLTETAALKVEKSARARTVEHLLRCKEYDVKCRSTLENAEKSNAELWEGVLLELNSPRTDGPQVFNRHPWNKLQRVVKDILKANRPTLSFEEREALLGGFLSEGMRQSAPSMHGLHLLRMRAILAKIPSSDPGVACLNSVLSGAEVMLAEACFERLLKTFAPFLVTPAPTTEEELFLSRAAKRASAQLRSAQLVDNTTPETIAAELRRLYKMDFSTLYDFVISPLKDTSSSAEEKQALGACLYVLGRRIEHDDEIYSHAPGVVPRSGSPNLVKNCLLEVWHKHSRRPSFSASNAARLGEGEQPTSEWDAFVSGVQKRNLVSPAVEAFHRAAFSDVFLHILIHHRLLALMDALALFRKALSSKENPETEKEPSRLVTSMRSLTSEELMQLMFTSEKLIPFSLALVAQFTRKDIYFLYFLRASGSATFFRIGHRTRSRITNFLKKWNRRNLICTPSCVEVSPSVDMEALKRKKVARGLSNMLQEQVEAFKNVTRSVSILNTSRAADLSASFQSLESPEMQAENVSPGSIDICSQQMTAQGGSVLPVCHYESVPYRYAHEAFRITLAQRAVPPRTWFQFFSMNHETVLSDCISEAKRFSKKQTLDDFTRLTEWRRFLPVALANAVKMLLAGFADIKKLLRLIEGRIASRRVGRLRALTHSLVKWIISPKKPSTVPEYKADRVRREAAIDVIDVISLGELRNLPEDVIVTSWRDYALPLDSSDPAGMQYDKTRRLLTAIGAGFKCAQMFSSAQKVFFGAMKGNKEAEEFVQRLAAEYFLSAGSPQESFRAMKVEATKAIATFCRGRRNKCKVSPNTKTDTVPDTCSRPLVFCTKALACANAKNSSRASSLNADCVLNLVDELITSPSPLVSTEVVFKSLAPVLSKLSYSISIWNQLTGTLTRFTQNQNSLFENIPIQLIVAPRSELEETVAPSEPFTLPSASGALPLYSGTPSTASSFVGLGSDADEEEGEEAYYSATSSPEPPSTPTPTETETEDTVVLLVSPGFDIYERLMEARRVADDGPSLTYTPHGGSFFQLERRLLEMQDKLSRLSPRQSMAAKSLDEMQSMIEELSNREDFRGSDILSDSKLYAALGPNADNQAFFSQQKHTIDTLLAEAAEPPLKLDYFLQQSLTGFQLFAACKDIPEECNAFRAEFLSRVKELLITTKAEGEAMLRIGQQQRSHLMSMDKIQEAIDQIEKAVRKTPPCLTDGCAEDTDALPKLLKPARRLLGAPKFHQLMREVMEKPAKDMNGAVPFDAFRLASHLTFPHLSMHQWIEVLLRLRQSESVLLAGPSVTRSIMSIVGTCVEIARRRLKDSLDVIQQSLQQMTPSAANEIALEAQERQHKQDEDELIDKLRARGYTISAGVDLGPLMDNRQTYSAWIQQAVTTQVEQADAVLRMMISTCSEGTFYSQGAAACTRKLLQAFESKKLKLDTLTSINTNKLSRKFLTYQEWLQYSGQLHVVSRIPTISQSLRSTGVARQHEAQVWTAIAEILYRAPDTPWKTVQKKLKEQKTTEQALSNLGLQAVKKLYSAVRTLHQAVGLVEEADFKRFGAYAITNLLVDHLKEKGVYVAGNSAVTLRTIRQAKTFQEWLQDIVLLKVSKELVKPPVPAILVSEVRRKRLGAFLFRRLARSQLVSNIIRSLVNKTVGLVTPYVIRKSMSQLKASEPAKAGAVGPALLSLAVLANCYLNMDFVVLTSLLPLVLGVMESHNTRSIVESILVRADIPRILGRTVLNFSAEIEDTIINVVTSNYLEPGALNDVLLRATGVNLQLQDLNLASSFSKVAAYLQEIIRREAPIVIRDLREVVIEPTVHGMMSYVQDLANTFLSVGAKEIPQRILSRPSVLNADLKNYYLGSSRVMDSEGQRFVYEAFLVAFSDQTLKALNPPLVPKGIIGFSPVQKIILNTFLAPFEGVVSLADFQLWERDWVLETKEYRMVHYRPLQAATYGFVGLLQLKVKIRGAKITLKFFVESVKEESPHARKTLKKVLGKKPLIFKYSAFDDGSGGTLRVLTQKQQLLATFITRQKPAMTQSLRQVEIIHQATSPLLKYSHQSYQAIQGSLENLDFMLKGMRDVAELNKCWEIFRSNSLFSLLLDFEYYNQVSWFTTAFHLAFTPQSRISGQAKIMVIPTEGRVYRTFTFDHYASQKMIARIPAGLYVPCGTSPSRLRRAFGAAATWLTGMAYGKESKCFRKVQYRRDAGGEMLDISWIEDGKLQNIRLPVQALGQPGANMAPRDRAEAALDRQTIRVVERVLNAEAGEAGSIAFPALRWLISTHIAGRSVLSGALRRERMLFETASLEQGEVQKLATKEQYSLEMHFFKRARTRTDPAWRLRVAALLNQAKYNELHAALGPRREEFVEALAKAYTTWIDRLQAEATEATATVVSAEQLEAMCQDKSRLEDCERNYGVWGSLYFQEADLTLARSIGTKRMESPYLFKYWRTNQEAATANLAIADFEALERYKHDIRRTHNVEVVGGLQASIAILLGKYTQALRAEEAGMEIWSDHKFQLLKYLHMQMRETLEEAKNPKEPNTTAILSSNLRAAGYDVLVRIPLHLRYTAKEAKERFGVLEGLADLFYRDLQLPARSIHLRSLYGLQINLYGSKVHLPFASRMMRSNPLASHAGFQLTRKNESIRDVCTPGFCPHTAVMWNHVYVTLLVLMQLAESPDIVAELLAADALTDITGFGLSEIPVTFEESFIAFKVGLDYLQQMEPKVAPSTFFTHPLSSDTITSLLTAFADFDRDFAVLLLHTPPPESAVALSSNNRAALQQGTWNAFIALWSFHEVFGRLAVDVLTSLEALPSFAPSTTLSIRGGRGFWMPQCVTDPLRAQLAVLFEPLPGQLTNVPAVMRAVDSALHELRPKIRKNGYISYTDPEILALWWQVMAIAFKNNPGMELEIEAFSRAPQKTQRFCEIIQQAATIAGFVSQLKMADTKSVLVRRAKRFGFESWTTLVESFYIARPPQQEVRQSLERIFHVACRMIPASSETQSIKILGKETDDVDLFRTLVDAITLRLMQLGRNVPRTMTHYPICSAIRVVSCEGFDLSDSALSKSCHELEVVRQRVLSSIDFSPKFCEAMQKAEEPLMERNECGEGERNHDLLKEFFLEYMTEQLESSAIKSQWSKIQEAHMLKYRNANLYPVAENALASMIHEAAIRLAEVPSNASEFPDQVRQAAEEVYSTMCNFVNYASASLALKDVNVCQLMVQPPGPLIQTLSDMLEAHMRRIQLGRFSSTTRPLPTFTLQQIVNSDSLPKHPADALTVGILRFVESYFTKGKLSEQSTEGGSAYQRVRRGLANTINLILDRLYKLKSRFAEWNQKVIRSLRLLVNYIVRLVLRSAKQMTYLGRKTLAMQQVEQKTQASMRRRLQQQREQKTGEQDSVSGDSTSTTASEDSASFVDVKETEDSTMNTSLLPSPSLSKDISLVQTGVLMRPDPKQGQGLLGIVRLLASMLLSDLPRSISDIVAHILPSVWNSISGVLRVKKSVVGSVKDTAEKVCVRVLDSTVLPGLISTNSLVPAGMIKTQMSLLARNIHFSVMPEASTVERNLKAARRKSGFLGMLVLIQGLVFVVAGQLEDLLQNADFQDRIVKIIHRRVRELAGVIQAAFKRYLVSEVVCESVEVIIDVIADVLSEKRDDFVQSVLEIIELDTLGRLSVFIESHVWRLIKLLLDGGGALDLMKGIIGQVGFLGAAKDTVRAAWGWFFGGPRAQSRTAPVTE
ncbi:hypothetical protein Emed_004856 [Eimeria media]